MALSDNILALLQRLESEDRAGIIFEDNALVSLQTYGEFHAVAAELRDKVNEPDLMVLLALRTMAKQKAILTPRLVDATLVATFPGEAGADTRHTRNVVQEMIQSARDEILVTGFAISEGSGLLQLLLESERKVNRITIICSDWKPDAGADIVTLFSRGWPADRPKPELFQYEDPAGKTGMHIKCLIVDARDMLIGSANFTYSGLNTNFELGLRIRGEVVLEARAVLEDFLSSGLFRRVF
jgi:phosphatidylserine/phosphatidylglycerophosphate/cardiolipin synthase-like enzyme